MARQSLVRFLRKTLKFPGKTVRSRDFWVCDINTTWEQFVTRAQEVEAKLKERGIVSEVLIEDECVYFKFVGLVPYASHPEQVIRPVSQAFMRAAIENGTYYVNSLWDINT